MIHLDESGEGYFKGNRVRTTGRKDVTTYSIDLYELELLEGPHKGEKIWQSVEATPRAGTATGAERMDGMKLTDVIARAAAQDAANRNKRNARRRKWSREDYNVACREYCRCVPKQNHREEPTT